MALHAPHRYATVLMSTVAHNNMLHSFHGMNEDIDKNPKMSYKGSNILHAPL